MCSVLKALDEAFLAGLWKLVKYKLDKIFPILSLTCDGFTIDRQS